MPTLTSTEHQRVAATLAKKLYELSVQAKLLDRVDEGPVVDVYYLVPFGKTRVSHIESLASDFAVALAVEDVVVKRSRGDNAVAVFVPRPERKFISFRETVAELWKQNAQHEVPICLGTDHLGRIMILDLAKLPHLLIAGSTGSGKSTLLHSILAGLCYCTNDVVFVLSDTKAVEFTKFIGAPQLLFEPATSVYRTLEQIDWIIEEVERRLKTLSAAGARNIGEYRALQREPLPSIVLVIDELADLLTDRSRAGKGPSIGKVAEEKLDTIVRRSRASGVYVIAATQRPSVNIVTGSIKANFPARATFRLPSDADSRTIIGEGGAEHLMSRGDMLFLDPNSARGVQRIHTPYASQEDLEAAVEVSVRRRSQ